MVIFARFLDFQPCGMVLWHSSGSSQQRICGTLLAFPAPLRNYVYITILPPQKKNWRKSQRKAGNRPDWLQIWNTLTLISRLLQSHHSHFINPKSDSRPSESWSIIKSGQVSCSSLEILRCKCFNPVELCVLGTCSLVGYTWTLL